jgi:hypothetical protein
LILLSQLPLHHLPIISAACWPIPSPTAPLPTCSSLPHRSTAQAADFTIPWTTRRCYPSLRCAWFPAALCSTFVPHQAVNLSPSARVSRAVVFSFATNQMATGGGG